MKFDDNVPLPLKKSELQDRYNFAAMKPGQSFFAMADTKEADKIAAAAREWGKTQDPPRTFVAERREEVTEKRADGTEVSHRGVRVWRKT